MGWTRVSTSKRRFYLTECHITFLNHFIRIIYITLWMNINNNNNNSFRMRVNRARHSVLSEIPEYHTHNGRPHTCLSQAKRRRDHIMFSMHFHLFTLAHISRIQNEIIKSSFSSLYECIKCFVMRRSALHIELKFICPFCPVALPP